jgi:uncharacterized protein YrzB (UPF0473 family)
MNSPSELLERLLKLYPVKVVKEHFLNLDSTKQSELIPEIVKKYPASAIEQFAFDKIGHTKQHVYIYRLNKKFDRTVFKKALFPIDIKSEGKFDSDSFYKNKFTNYVFLCFPVIEYDVSLMNPLVQERVNFIQPTRVVISGQNVVVQTTIMEKKLDSYFPEDRKVLDVIKRNGEDQFIAQIIKFFQKDYYIQICDLNKGVKNLWEHDVVDSRYVKFKKSKSTTTETMDEEYTLKAQYPEVYKQIMAGPMNKTVFRYLRGDDKFSRTFMVDPTQGELSMNIFPENTDQIWNVINEILAGN